MRSRNTFSISHFTATKLATQNVLRMGEERQRNQVGCPTMDVLRQADLNLEKFFDRDMECRKETGYDRTVYCSGTASVTHEHQGSGFQMS